MKFFRDDFCDDFFPIELRPCSLRPIPQSNSHFGKIFEVGFQGMADEVRESQNPQKSTGSTIVRHTALELKGCWDSRSFAVGLNEMIRFVTPDKPAAPWRCGGGPRTNGMQQ